MIKHQSQRVAVLIDVQNMYYSARNLFNAKVNFGNIVAEAVGDRQLTRAIAYVVRTKTGEERPFFEALGKAGIETKEKELQIFLGGAKKADWDVGLAIDAIVLAEKVDSIVIVSGDGDFEPLVQYLKITKGAYVEIAAFRETASSKIIEAADNFIDLSADKTKYLLGNKERKTDAPIFNKISDSKPKEAMAHNKRRGRPRIPLSKLE